MQIYFLSVVLLSLLISGSIAVDDHIGGRGGRLGVRESNAVGYKDYHINFTFVIEM